MFVICGCSPTEGVITGSIEGYVYVPIYPTQLNSEKIEPIKTNSRVVPGGYKPLSGALVSISGCDETATTDSNGYFRIDRVQVGIQLLSIAEPGSENIIIQVEVEILENQITHIYYMHTPLTST